MSETAEVDADIDTRRADPRRGGTARPMTTRGRAMLAAAVAAVLLGACSNGEGDDASGDAPDPAVVGAPVADLVEEHPDRWDLEDPIVGAAVEFGIDPEVFSAQVWVESSWRTDVVSSAGAVGPAQVLPDTGQAVASDIIGEPELDVADPDDNLRIGAAYLASLLDEFGDIQLALAAYNSGPSSITSSGASPGGLQYALEVMALVEG